ncbi:twin-arginine translocation signal domain-containing protein [Daejeonella oryzae]|uniref:twin-arginine translocation signal domain-containing protein n=1 Tax=Daejeonella oryzae TaxID=1122943 RepID=UPI0003F605F7|nr:twin-arginine translocation signal domain-containing protein [Daejeonella oryzae]
MSYLNQHKNSRREFLGNVATGAATIGLTSVLAPLDLAAKNSPEKSSEDAWFDKINGKHRMVFDATMPHEILPFAWPRVFLMTNEKTGTPEKENSVVVVLRHAAIPYAMEDKLWTTYKFGELFKADDPATKKASLRNPFWKPKSGDYKIPGVGNVAIGINELQESGVMFCVCDMALTVYSAAVASELKKDPAEIKKEWIAGILPGIEIVPSGVWALNRAQEHGCSYCFAG